MPKGIWWENEFKDVDKLKVHLANLKQQEIMSDTPHRYEQEEIEKLEQRIHDIEFGMDKKRCDDLEEQIDFLTEENVTIATLLKQNRNIHLSVPDQKFTNFSANRDHIIKLNKEIKDLNKSLEDGIIYELKKKEELKERRDILCKKH